MAVFGLFTGALDTFAYDGVGLACSRLSICENSGACAILDEFLNDLIAALLIDFILNALVIEHMVKLKTDRAVAISQFDDRRQLAWIPVILW